MGIPQSKDINLGNATALLRTVFGVEDHRKSMPDLKISRPALRKSKSLEIKRKRAKETKVTTRNAEITKRLQNELAERYKRLMELKRPRHAKSPGSRSPRRKRRVLSKKIETDTQEKVTRGTSSLKLDLLLSSTHKPWFVSQWFHSVDGLRYGITIDTNNPDVMTFLKKFSKDSTSNLDPTSAENAILTFKLNTGDEVTLRFNKWDTRTLEVLTQATLISTGSTPSIGVFC